MARWASRCRSLDAPVPQQRGTSTLARGSFRRITCERLSDAPTTLGREIAGARVDHRRGTRLGIRLGTRLGAQWAPGGALGWVPDWAVGSGARRAFGQLESGCDERDPSGRRHTWRVARGRCRRGRPSERRAVRRSDRTLVRSVGKGGDRGHMTSCTNDRYATSFSPLRCRSLLVGSSSRSGCGETGRRARFRFLWD
jgi:hypothetical protein